jgi:hypothetical protein
VIVDHSNFKRYGALEFKKDSPRVVDTNRLKPFTASFQQFRPGARRHPKVGSIAIARGATVGCGCCARHALLEFEEKRAAD